MLKMNILIFLCLFVTQSVICNNHVYGRQKYSSNYLNGGERHDEFKDRNGLKYGTATNSATSHIHEGSIVKREHEENAGEIVKDIVNIIANNLPESGK